MKPLWERARDILNRRGEESARDDVGRALDAWDADLFEELSRQIRAMETPFQWQYPERAALYRAWRAYKKEGIQLPPTGEPFDVPMGLYQTFLEFVREVGWLADVRPVSIKRNCAFKISEQDGFIVTLQGPRGRFYQVGITVFKDNDSEDVEIEEWTYQAVLRYRIKHGEAYGGYANDYHDWRHVVFVDIGAGGVWQVHL
jgi:hypothetical protein